MNTIETTTENVIAEGHFERGADILRDGKLIYRVSPCTWSDDDAEKVVNENGEAVVYISHRYGNGQPDDEFVRLKSLGPVEGLEVIEDSADND